MKKFVIITLLLMVFISPILAEEVSATSIYLTSDNVLGQGEDYRMLSQIKHYIEESSGGDIDVIIDGYASNPGEGSRAVASGCDYAVTVAYPCAGNIEQLAIFSVNSPMKIIFINAGPVDLDKVKILRRAYDDNWSDISFASVKNPGKFLSDAGITYLQPTQVYPEETNDKNLRYSDKICKYLADSILSEVHSNKEKSSTLDTDLIVKHELNPKKLADTSKLIVENPVGKLEDKYGNYTTPQALYMSASYLVGYGLTEPPNFKEPTNPDKNSLFTKGEYSFYDYAKIADIVVDYMNENGRPPNHIQYEGASIGYNDLVYNFALITENQTDANHMNFPNKIEFKKQDSSIIKDVLYYGIIAIIVITIIGVIKSLMNKRKAKKKKQRKRPKIRKSPQNKPKRLKSPRRRK